MLAICAPILLSSALFAQDPEPQPEPAPDPVRVTGRLVQQEWDSEESQPAEGVLVAGVAKEPTDHRVQLEYVYTDADGRFEMELARPAGEEFIVQISTPPGIYYGVAIGERELSGDAAGAEFELVRLAHPPLRGEVTDPRGKPLAGVRMRFGNESAGDYIAHWEAVSAEDGTFELERFSGSEFPMVEHGDFVILTALPFERHTDGSWKLWEIVLCPTGSATVKVTDAGGEPIEGIYVKVDLAESERELFPREQQGSPRRSPVTATGPDGAARLQEVWAGRKLRLFLEIDAQGTIETERVRDGMLVLDRSGSGDPMVLEAGEHRAWTAELPPDLRVSGTVRLSEGELTEWAVVQAYDYIPGGERRNPQFRTRVRTDSDGKYSFAVPSSARGLPIQVRAEFHGFQTNASGTRVPARAATSTLLDGIDPEQEELSLDLILEPLYALRGTIVDEDGEPAQGRLSIAGFEEQTGRPNVVATRARGEFHFQDLPPGTYEVVVTLNRDRHSIEYRFPGLDAGNEDIELKIVPKEVARVTAVVEPPDEKFESMTVNVARLTEAGNAALPEAPPSQESEFDARNVWPAEGSFRWGGTGELQDAHGTWTYAGYPARESESELPPLEEGYYRILVSAFDSKSRGYALAGTGIVRLEPGEYRFRFELQPAAELHARILTDAVQNEWRAALADSAGRLVPFEKTGERVGYLQEISAAGEVRLTRVPAGKFELWIGTAEALRSGEPLRRVQVELAPGENPLVSVEWP